MNTSAAHAHRVNVFAWTEGNTIHTESTFSNGKASQQASIKAFIKGTTQIIASGNTDKDGKWSFQLPDTFRSASKDKTHNIVISLDAGEGHAATWTVTAEEYLGGTPAQTPSTLAGSGEKNAPMSTIPLSEIMAQTTKAAFHSPAIHKTVLQEEALRKIVGEELEKRLAPIRRQLAVQQQHGPSLQDIFGGIGYILGLFGIAAFMSTRHKK